MYLLLFHAVLGGSYTVYTENLCFCILERNERILYRWKCSVSVQEQMYTLEFHLEVLQQRVWKYGCICLNTFNSVWLMAPLWMKNYSLEKYKVFWISAVEWKCYLQTGKSSVAVSHCSDKFFFFFLNGSKVL